jgi:DMSO/TMAO reductase YedYZ molybdopterin-dependent catalytic subunit
MQQVSSVRLDPDGPYMRHPLAPHQLLERWTRTEGVIVLCHLGVPRLGMDEWSLTIDGLVDRPRTLRFEDLIRFPKVEVASVHNCCGSPFEPLKPTRRVANITWAGARLADVLADCGPRPEAKYLWSSGADSGEFSGVRVEPYTKDLPLMRAGSDVLLAYEMNRRPLAPEHGSPVRLAVPGFYGTNSVKWLTRLTLAKERAHGLFTTRWYNDPVLDGDGREMGETIPVWSIAPDSVIVSPGPQDTIRVSAEHEVWGWAWADGGVRSLRVCTGDDEWRLAELEAHRGYEWQRFSIRWMPLQRGTTTLASLAEASNGQLQPMSGRRNAIHQVTVNVV